DGCGCAGTVSNPCASLGGDSDGDGICDNEDCQPNNPAYPATPGTACNDGNPNTINDVVAANGCGCAGQITTPTCEWTQHDYSNFEAGYGFWVDGGSDCERAFLQGANGSLWAIELEDNGSNAAMYTPAMDLSEVTDIKFDFLYKGHGMDHGEKLMLEFSVNGGSSYAVIQEWIKGIHFSNGSYISESVSFSHTFSANTKFRFRCHASSALDKVYVDNVTFSMCEDVPFDPYANQRPVYRTIDGSLNNFDHPEWGKANIPLYREIPAAYGDGQGSLAGPNRPSPRHISNQLSDEPQDRRDERLLSGMAYQFGQFLDHDIVLSEGGNEQAPIQVPGYDPIFTPNSIIPFTRSAAIPGSSPREQANSITSYIDASHIYGSDPERAAWLRTFQDGKLKTSKGNLLPYNTIDGEYDSPTDINAPRMERDMQGGQLLKLAVAGDIRANEHPNLTALHTIFVREHNRLCDLLKNNGETDDEVIYQKARKIVGAMMQRIVYDEYLPAFGVSLSSYSGYHSDVRPDIKNTFATAAYRWHTMVENDIILRNDQCEGVAGVELPLKTIFMNPSIIRKYGPGVLLRGLSFHPQYRTDLKVNNGLRNFLFGPGAGLDLVSINLQRGRDHGLPDYKTVRAYYGLGNISSFSDINSDAKIHSKLHSLYADVNDIDLWAGIFAEPLVNGTSLPATAIAILKRQFESLREGDFYFYKNDPALSSWDMNLINSSDLATIIERNSSARALPTDIFFKPPCDDEDPLEDLKDEGNPVCTGSGATFYTSCSSTSGSNKSIGTFSGAGIRKIKINLGFAVRIYSNQGEVHYYTDDTGCLPAELQNNISSVEVLCLSNDDSTVDCSSFAGALFSSCFSSPLPILTPGMYNTEQLKSLSVSNDDVEAIRVHKGFKVTLYEHDNFQGTSWEYIGPTVLCLPHSQKNKMSSMKVVCLSDPDRSNCEFNGIAGAIFQNHSDHSDSHLGVSVGVGDYTMSRMIAMGAGNDNTRQIKVNNGYAITLFEHDNFGGNYTVYMGDESDLSTTITETEYPIWDILGLFPYTNTVTMDDKTSSMKVRCIESLQSSPLIAESVLDLRAVRAGERAQLDVSYIFSKEVVFLRIEKYDGKLGDFDILHDFTTDRIEDIYTYYDDEPLPGDNIYRVKVFYADDTEAETAYRTVRFPQADNFTVYPNPAINIVNVEMEKYLGQAVDIVIYDMLGVEIAAQRFEELNTAGVSFSLSNVMAGTYIVRVTADGQKGVSKKLTIVKP
ncbi:MAG: peroxidase family protein, partial [Saprospiraceae bacterium]